MVIGLVFENVLWWEVMSLRSLMLVVLLKLGTHSYYISHMGQIFTYKYHTKFDCTVDSAGQMAAM